MTYPPSRSTVPSTSAPPRFHEFGVTGDGLNDVVVSGPRGSGKSVLLAHWRTEAVAAGRRVASIDVHHAGPIPDDVDVVFVDDVDPRDPADREAIRVLFTTLPQACRAIIASRAPRAAFDDIALRLVEAHTVAPQQLVFDADMIAATLRERRLPDGDAAVDVILEVTHGWAWLVGLALDEYEYLREQSGGDLIALDLSRVRLVSVVDAAVRSRLGALRHAVGIEALMLTTRVQPGAVGEAGAAAFDALVADGWVEYATGPARIARIPVPVRRAIMTELTAERRQGLAAERHAIVKGLIAAEDLQEAWRVAFDGLDLPSCWRVLAQAVVRLDTALIYAMVMELRTLSVAVLARHPFLASWVMGYNIGMPELNRRFTALSESIEHFDALMPAETADRLFHAGLAQTLRRRSGDLPGAVRWADETRALWRGLRPRVRVSKQGHGALAMHTSGLTYLLAGRWATAATCFAEAVAISRTMGAQEFLANTTQHLAVAQVLAGEVAAARLTLEESERGSAAIRPSYLGQFGGLTRALIAVEDGDPRAAQAAVSEMRRDSNQLDSWSLVESVTAITAAFIGSPPSPQGFEVALRAAASAAPTSSQAAIIADVRVLLVLVRRQPAALMASHRRAQRDRRTDDWGLSPLADLLADDRPRLLAAMGRAMRTTADTPRAAIVGGLALAAAAIRYDLPEAAEPLLISVASTMQQTGAVSAVRLLPQTYRDELAPVAAGYGLDTLAARLTDVDLPSLFTEFAPPPPLTAREEQVLQALAEDLTQQRIADLLGVSINTLKTLTRRLYAKLGATSREQAVARAVELGISDEPV